jgi:hypothetical protein
VAVCFNRLYSGWDSLLVWLYWFRPNSGKLLATLILFTVIFLVLYKFIEYELQNGAVHLTVDIPFYPTQGFNMSLVGLCLFAASIWASRIFQ